MERVLRHVGLRGDEITDTPMHLARRIVKLGLFLMLIFFGIFGVWSMVAPLESAAVASGQVILNSNKKTVQHLEGGIVDEILVHEGEYVQKGQKLIRLKKSEAKAQLGTYTAQLINAKATAARLTAERDEKDNIDFPSDITSRKKEAEIAEIMHNQQKIFAARRESFNSQINIIKQKIAEQEHEITGLNAQVSSTARQMALLQDEIKGIRKLFEQGNASKTRLLALEREYESQRGRKEQTQAQIARAKQNIIESEYTITSQKNETISKIVQELKETQGDIATLEEQISASTDVNDRMLITAPIEGYVTDLKVHTKDGVIGAGEKVLDIVPTGDKLVIEVQISPLDIDVVRPDLKAHVRLSAYKTRWVPVIEGKVVNVSADRFTDNRTGAAYFLARVEADPEQLKHIARRVSLYPGMPAEVLIVTGERTLFSYLFSPLTDSMHKAFREE